MALRRLALACAISLIAAQAAPAADALRVDALRVISSSVAKDRGSFKDEGIDLDGEFFKTAQSIPVAVVSGDLDFGVTQVAGPRVDPKSFTDLSLLSGTGPAGQT